MLPECKTAVMRVLLAWRTGDKPFIAETVADLARLARRHRLGMLIALLEMAQLEAEERIRLRSKRRLS